MSPPELDQEIYIVVNAKAYPGTFAVCEKSLYGDAQTYNGRTGLTLYFGPFDFIGIGRQGHFRFGWTSNGKMMKGFAAEKVPLPVK